MVVKLEGDQIVTNSVLGRELGVGRDLVYQAARRLGIQPVRAGKTGIYTPEQARQIVAELTRPRPQAEVTRG